MRIRVRYGLVPDMMPAPDSCPQVGFVVRLEGHRLTADLEDELPDFEFAFESTGVAALAVMMPTLLLLTRLSRPVILAAKVFHKLQVSPVALCACAWLHAVSIIRSDRCCAGGDGEGYGAYYRSERTRALDEHFGDMLHKIHDLEARSLAPSASC